jgi:triosephosphate isomerase
MRQTLVAGNWKLNGSKESIQTLVKGIADGMSDVGGKAVAVCPPYVYIPMVAELVDGTDIRLGSQDVADQETGAFTGEVSAAMLKEVGCQYAIVGHSERRSIYGEQDADTASKFAAARKEGLIPILCLGELLEEREAGNTEKVVARQLDAVIDLEGVEALSDAVIAYEPVWAIGTGVTASPDQAQDVHAFIRKKIAGLNAGVADKVQILYGGSVNGGNATELFAMEDIDGGLIGGASLTSEDFLAICTA